jgi:GT2 family glycosyltransferase
VPDATIVITTKNRRDELRTALQSAVAQRGADIEVLVLDDGSGDGTGDMVRAEFPDVRLEHSDAGGGLIAARNEAARRAHGAIVVSIDDDAEFSDPGTVAGVLRAFEHPRVGALAMPHIHTRLSPDVVDRAPDPDAVWCTWTYIGTAHAVRREAFLAIGGYREEFGSRVEEPDLCLRLLDRGLVCRLGSTPPILHHESPKRDPGTIGRQTGRNELVEAWRTVPATALPARLARVTGNMVRLAARTGDPRAYLSGLGAGAATILRDRRREPVARDTWRAARILMTDRAVSLERIEPLLQAPAPR